MAGMKELTEEVMAELSGKGVEERRNALTALHDEGFNIRPYIESMLKPGIDDRGVTAQGFRTTNYGSEFLAVYNLSHKKSFFYKKKSDGTYTEWPS